PAGIDLWPAAGTGDAADRRGRRAEHPALSLDAGAVGRLPGESGPLPIDHRVLPRGSGPGGEWERVMGHETLLEHLQAGGARRFDTQGAPAVHDFGDTGAEYRAARETAALFPLTWRGALRFVGP